MTKRTYILFLLLVLLSAVTPHSVFAKKISETEEVNAVKTERYVRYVYDHMKFGKNIRKISYEAFRSGFLGYLNLLESGKLNNDAYLTICDFTLSSNQKRMWVFDVKAKKVLFHTLVAHGQGTGEEYAVQFSNTPESHQSSLGFYTTGETYEGGNGYSLKLNGVDGIFNSNAYERAIVIHAADYVSEEFARCNQRIGRSHGCPALPVDIAPKVIDQIKNGTCLFIYHSSKNYLTASQWINRRPQQLPQEAELMDLQSASKITKSNKPIKTPAKAEVEDELASVSLADRKNYKVDVQTITIKRPVVEDQNIQNSKIISSIIVINENERKGFSQDTVILK
ncbi:MAG: murein L,D-transpeptidase catalytic domain family protein [Chitinophagaceae bacterium]|nr:murein L,D-transpeptidase catalytic domain family protein [Chitinophagaceae bacterium]